MDSSTSATAPVASASSSTSTPATKNAVPTASKSTPSAVPSTPASASTLAKAAGISPTEQEKTVLQYAHVITSLVAKINKYPFTEEILASPEQFAKYMNRILKPLRIFSDHDQIVILLELSGHEEVPLTLRWSLCGFVEDMMEHSGPISKDTPSSVTTTPSPASVPVKPKTPASASIASKTPAPITPKSAITATPASVHTTVSVHTPASVSTPKTPSNAVTANTAVISTPSSRFTSTPISKTPIATSTPDRKTPTSIPSDTTAKVLPVPASVTDAPIVGKNSRFRAGRPAPSSWSKRNATTVVDEKSNQPKTPSSGAAAIAFNTPSPSGKTPASTSTPQ